MSCSDCRNWIDAHEYNSNGTTWGKCSRIEDFLILNDDPFAKIIVRSDFECVFFFDRNRVFKRKKGG
jgi:hypothetical protein